MNARLNTIVSALQAQPGDQGLAQGLSAGEQCFVALAAGRYEFLPGAYDDPVEAWHRLTPAWQRAVCQWRGWPESWAGMEGAGHG